MTIMIEKAIERLKTEKDQIEKLKKFKENIVDRLNRDRTETKFLCADSFYAYGAGTEGKIAFLSYGLVNLLLPPEVIIPAVDSLIEKLEKSTAELGSLLSVFESAIRPVVAPAQGE